MAHAIIFVDRAPRTRSDDYTSYYLSATAGAYKIASVVRDLGLEAVVIPLCFNFTFAGIRQIIENNSNNLLWVGISNTFMTYETDDMSAAARYRSNWNQSKELTIDTSDLMVKTDDIPNSQNLWEINEISKIGFYLEKRFKVPLLIGGVNSEQFALDINLNNPFHKNIYLVQGYAESYVKEFTERRLKDSSAKPNLFVDNKHYDDNEFKLSTINWKNHDLLTPSDWLPIETARGCAFNCAYCSYPRRSNFDSFKDPDTLRQELIRNYEEFGITRYNIIDDLYNDTKDKVRIFYDKVWSKLPFKAEWTANMRLDMIYADPDSAQIILDSGLRYGQFGIETMHDEAGRKVGKGLGKKRILDTLAFLKPIWGTEALVGANFIAGLPHEPLDHIKEIAEWSVKTDLIYQPNWSSLWIAPPDKLKIMAADQTTRIEKDYDKFGITWLNDHEWINSVGVKLSDTKEIPKWVLKNLSTPFKINLRNYIDLRTTGFTHERLADLRHKPFLDQELTDSNEWCQSQVEQRLRTILNLKT